jgi:hypothetical protein
MLSMEPTMDVSKLDGLVWEYLQTKVFINKHDSKWKMLGVRESATSKEVEMAFRYYVLFVHPDKQGFMKFLDQHGALDLNEIAACKSIMLEFFNTWTKNKEDLRLHDIGLVPKAG